jgi:hypothetical protein
MDRSSTENRLLRLGIRTQFPTSGTERDLFSGFLDK